MLHLFIECNRWPEWSQSICFIFLSNRGCKRPNACAATLAVWLQGVLQFSRGTGGQNWATFHCLQIGGWGQAPPVLIIHMTRGHGEFCTLMDILISTVSTIQHLPEQAAKFSFPREPFTMSTIREFTNIVGFQVEFLKSLVE